jgi:TRAP-type C4-dicarboxylate transport system permease small subunit
VSHGVDSGAGKPHVFRPGFWGALARTTQALNRLIDRLGSIALVLAASVLTYSVFSRYLFKAATDWQDELAVFLLVGAVFTAGANVQAYRGHIGIEALASILPARVNRVRAIAVDVLSMLFCGFFAWKSWTLFHEAWVDKQTTSSSWAPPLTIPYGLMAFGMTLLTLQILLQVAARLDQRGGGQ